MSKIKVEKSRLKICFLVTGFGGGGAEKQCALLINSLQLFKDVSIQLIYFEDGVNSSRIIFNGIESCKIPFSSYYNPLNIYRVEKLIRKSKPDIIFSWLPVADIYAFVIKLRYRGIKWIVAERDSHYALKLKNLLRLFVVKFSDTIISNSISGKRYWTLRGYKSEKIHTIRNIFDFKEPTQFKKLIGKPVILYVGRFVEQKNVVRMTSLFCKAAESIKDARFYLIGKGDQTEVLQTVISRNGKGDVIKILPFMRDIENYLASANIFVSLSHHEGSPNALIEGIALGALPIVSDIPEHKEILGDDYPYYWCEKDGEVQFSNLIINATLNWEQKRNFLRYAEERISEMNVGKISVEYLNVFLSLKGVKRNEID